ncbi:gamma-glutamyltransferase [Vibrio sp. FNV 38]|nr:gamma-glutamyltransferase [Vibrio sp. FNV 38]
MRFIPLTLTLISSMAFGSQPTPFPTEAETSGQQFMVSATNPYVSSTGYQILKNGGNAIDAMVAMQMVMSVVEPDMTGIGGGTFALYYDNQTQRFQALDGREEAPLSATPDMFMEQGNPITRNQTLGPRSVAIPGTLKLLYDTHQAHGELAWAELLQPAITLASQGYAMNSYTYDIVVREQERLINDPEMQNMYWVDGHIKPTGTLMRNPDIAHTLKMIAQHGDSYLYGGEFGQRIVKTVNQQIPDGKAKLSIEDFEEYRVKQRDVIETNYNNHKIVSFGYPASGGMMVSQTLGLLAPFELSQMGKTEAEPWRLMTEAMRISKADRISYAGDPDYVDIPQQTLLDKHYLDQRRHLIPNKGVQTSEPASTYLLEINPAQYQGFESKDTGHISIVDKKGNAIAMTSTIGTGMGAGIMVDGVVLNAQMANFSPVPSIDGKPVQNAIAAGKRPRSAITPLMMLDEQQQLRLVIGSPGSSQIPGYVLKTLIGMIDWNLSAQDAIDLPNIQYGTKIDRTQSDDPSGLLVEKKTYAEMLVPEFIEQGYPVEVLPMVSGLNAIEIKNGKITGASDRRRASSSMGE